MRKLAFAMLGLALLPLGARVAASAPQQHAAEQHEAVTSRAHVYLMRGLMNIFSLGMDSLGAQIQHHGISAVVYNHSMADSVVGDIISKYRAGDHGPYILIGHSLGADAVMQMAQMLNHAGVPVALVIPFDGTGSYGATGNVACVLNLTQRNYAYMRAAPGFHGQLSNVNVASSGVDHFTIDKSPQLQARALSAVISAASGHSCRNGAAEPAVARPAEPGEPAAKPAEKTASPVVHTGDAAE